MKLLFRPKPDITAFELAVIYSLLNSSDGVSPYTSSINAPENIRDEFEQLFPDLKEIRSQPFKQGMDIMRHFERVDENANDA